MRNPAFMVLVILTIVSALSAESSAQSPTPNSIERQRFNQVYVKVMVPVTLRTPKQDGPVVEAWVAEQLKEMGEHEFFAVTDWVPVCDALLEDEIVNNRVWDGSLTGNHPYCPVGGDIPRREKGYVLVNVGGWTPGGGEANILLADEPGSRAVGPVRLREGKEGKRDKIEEGLPYVAVIIVPPLRPLQKRDTTLGDAKKDEAK